METVEQAVAEVGRVLSYRSNMAAEKVADLALARFPDSGDCLAMVALTKLWRGQVEVAESSIAKARKLDPNSLVVKAIAGEIEFYMGRKEAGIKLIDEAWAVAPDHWTVLRQANLYGMLGQPQIAKEMLERRIRLDPENPAGYQAQCTNYLTRNDLASLQGFLDAAPDCFRDTCGYHRSRASLAVKKRDVATAEHHLRLAVAAEPESVLAWSRLASVLASSGKLQEAERAAGFALEINPRWSPAYSALASIARARGDTAKQSEYERLAKETAPPGIPKNPAYWQATEARRRGDNDARVDLLTVVPPDEGPMHRGMRLLALADALREGKDFERLEGVIADLEAEGCELEEYFGAKAALLSHRGDQIGALDKIETGLTKLNNAISLMADKVVLLKLSGRNEDAAVQAKATASAVMSSAPRTIHAITVLVDAGFPDEANNLLTRAERQMPSRELDLLRMMFDVRQRPELAKQLAQHIEKEKRKQARAQADQENPLRKVFSWLFKSDKCRGEPLLANGHRIQ